MWSPRWVDEELYRVHKQCRLGWVGQERGPEDELNKGYFGLIQLYHKRDADKTFFGDKWGDRGPLFGRSFDPIVWVPIYLMDIEPVKVFDGSVIGLLKQWIRPMRDRFMASAREKGEAYQTQLDNLAGEQGSYMHWKAQQTDSTRPEPLAQKFVTPHDKAVLAGDTIKGVKDAFTKLPVDAQPME